MPDCAWRFADQKGSVADPTKQESPFLGYPAPVSNTTYVPNQFFDVVLPHSSRGCVRLVAFMLRKTLGWCDSDGSPQEPVATISYKTLIEQAGISRGMIKHSIEEALTKNFIRCVQPGAAHTQGSRGSSALYELRWEESEEYVTNLDRFGGFFAGNGNLTYVPNAFFDYTVPRESLAVVKVVGAIIRHTIGFQTKFGFRRQHIKMSFTELQRRTKISSRRTLNEAIKYALTHQHIQRVEAGYFDTEAGTKSVAATYGIRWLNPDQIADSTRRLPGSSEAFKKDTEQSVQKGNRRQFENETGKRSKSAPAKRFEKDTGIEIKQEIKPRNKGLHQKLWVDRRWMC